jgi:hypothetical protein
MNWTMKSVIAVPGAYVTLMIAALIAGAGHADTNSAQDPELNPSHGYKLAWMREAHAGSVASIVLSPDSSRALSVGPSDDCSSELACSSAIVWDTASGEPINELVQGADLAAGLFTRDGSAFLVTGCEQPTELPCHDLIHVIADASNGAHLITVANGFMRLPRPRDEAGNYQLDDGRSLDANEVRHLIELADHWTADNARGSPVRAAALGADQGSLHETGVPVLFAAPPVADTAPSMELEIMRPGFRSNGPDITLEGPGVRTAAFSPYKSGLALAREDGSITLLEHDLHTGFTGERLDERLAGCDARSAAHSANGFVVIVGCAQGGVRMADIRFSPLRMQEFAHIGTPMGVTFAVASHDGALIAVAGEDGRIALFRRENLHSQPDGE